ncbi:MAG: DNA-directed RNA polymerase subunit omega [Lentisphaeria bacterium]|nr:DNA-directed RNA polymerase subunit omega [Lentisphaeria bacterium]MBR7127563.1 DNA-directed RNA polymerase subunit omega [Lentisphaeria bacterium]
MNNDYLNRAKKQITDPQILSIVVGRRAKQLALGARPMIKTADQEFLDIALLEIAEGLLSYEIPTKEELEAEKAAALEANNTASNEE